MWNYIKKIPNFVWAIRCDKCGDDMTHDFWQYDVKYFCKICYVEEAPNYNILIPITYKKNKKYRYKNITYYNPTISSERKILVRIK